MLILTFIGVYFLSGGVFAVAFFARGFSAINADARATVGARLLWLPAAALLWPALAWKWRRARGRGATVPPATPTAAQK